MTNRTHEPLVYYVLRGGLIKIGTTTQLRQRLVALKIDELLAVEPGSYDLERRRHAEFAEYHAINPDRRGPTRGPYEWFSPGKALTELTQALRVTHGLPDWSRWELRQLTPEERASVALLPPLRMKVRPGTLERFAFGLTIGTGDACWYRKPKDSTRKGYGRIYFEGKHCGAHVASYLMFVGPIPDGFDLDHMCHDSAECRLASQCPHRACVNPAHLEPKTPRDNVRRIRKVRCKNGHLLTEENTYRRKRGGRQCKACVLAAGRTKASGKKCGDFQRERTHCKNGHEYTPDNTIVHHGDKRICKTCRRASARRWREAARQAQERSMN